MENANKKYEIRRAELGRLLRASRDDRGLTLAQVDSGIAKLGLRRLLRGGRSLESARSGTVRLSITELDLIAQAYEIAPLMLDPLLSERVAEGPVVETFTDFMGIGTSQTGKKYGVGTRYSIPARKLAGTEGVAVVYLEFDPVDEELPRTHSDTHTHPGVEIMTPIVGEVEVRLSRGGLHEPLSVGDLIAFDSTQEHSAWNAKKDHQAIVFIIRSYQLGALLSDGEDTTSNTRRRRGRQEQRDVERDLHVARRMEWVPNSEFGDAEVADRLGLGRLLRRVAQSRADKAGRLSLDDLVERAESHGLKGYDRSKLDRVHHGRARVRLDELAALAKTYGVQPFLLYDFVFPVRQDDIVVRQANSATDTESDWWPVDTRFLGTASGSEHQGCRYFVPCRRLSISEVSVAMLELDAGSSTPANTHPGQELLLPLSGHVLVEVRGVRTDLKTPDGPRLCAHYHSTATHRVFNVGDSLARVLVFRFYA